MEQIIKCADCAYFLNEEWGVKDKQPAIIAYDVCMKWNGQTSPTGYCFKACHKEGIVEKE